MSQSTTALARALEFLRSNLQIAWSDGERLPTTLQLSALAGVSRGTMAKAVAVLVQEGRLTARRRRGIVAGRPSTAFVPLPPRSLQKWEQLKHRIEADIYDGDLHTVALLPPAKQLQVRYAVDFRTLKKALDGLVGERVLHPHKRTYRVVRPEDALGENTVAYISPQDLFRVRYRNFPEAGDLVRMLESECGRRRLLFRPYSMGDVETVQKVVRDYRVLGGLFYQSAPYGREVFEEFAAMRKPVAMYDNYNHVQSRISVALMIRYRMRVFQFDEVSAGAEVGRFLLSLGHRTIALSSPFHADWVDPIRFESIRGVVEGSGQSHRVELISHSNLRETLQRRATEILSSRPDSETRALTRRASEDLSALGLGEANDGVLLDWAAESQNWTLSPDNVYNRVLQRELQPLFEKALALGPVTAWVCANDGIAIHALRFLRMRRVAVPEYVSVIGFDNIGDSSYNNLSSYDFDVPAVALKMLDHVLRPDSSLHSPGLRIVNTPGMVIPRASTAAPRA